MENYDISDFTDMDNSPNMDTSEAEGNDAVDFDMSENVDTESIDTGGEIEALDFTVENVSDSAEDTSDIEVLDIDEIDISDVTSENELDEATLDPLEVDETSDSEEIEALEAEYMEESGDLPTNEVSAVEEEILELDQEAEEAEIQPIEELDDASEEGEEEILDISADFSGSDPDPLDYGNEGLETAGEDIPSVPIIEDAAADIPALEAGEEENALDSSLPDADDYDNSIISGINTELPDSYPNPYEYEAASYNEGTDIGDWRDTEEAETPDINTNLPGSYLNPLEYEEELGSEETDIGEAEETQEVPTEAIVDDTVSDIPELEFETAEEDAQQGGGISDTGDPNEAEIPTEEIETTPDSSDFLENDPEQALDFEEDAFKPDQAALWEAGLHAIDNNVEALRDNLRDQGMEDGPEMEEIVMEFRRDSMEELRRDLEGELPGGNFMEILPIEEDGFDDSSQQIDADGIMAESKTPDDLPDFSVETDDPEGVSEDAVNVDEPEEISEIDEDAFDESSPEDLQDTDQETEREYDDFERSVMDEKPDFYDSGAFYEQGINEYGYEGTCGPTSQANAINKLLETNEFTEQKILKIAVDNDLCNLDESPENCGGTTTEQFVELYDTVNEQIGDKIQTELYEYENALSVEEAAAKLDEGCVLNVAVDAMALWDQPREYVNPLGVPCDDFYSDHWITVTGVQRDEAGNVLGFNIIDSGGGVDYVDADKYQEMCFGSADHRVLDPTAIVVSKKETPMTHA